MVLRKSMLMLDTNGQGAKSYIVHLEKNNRELLCNNKYLGKMGKQNKNILLLAKRKKSLPFILFTIWYNLNKAPPKVTYFWNQPLFNPPLFSNRDYHHPVPVLLFRVESMFQIMVCETGLVPTNISCRQFNAFKQHIICLFFFNLFLNWIIFLFFFKYFF